MTVNTEGLGGVTLYGSNPFPIAGFIGGVTKGLESDSSSILFCRTGTPSFKTTGPATPLVTPGGRLVILGLGTPKSWAPAAVAALDTAACTRPRIELTTSRLGELNTGGGIFGEYGPEWLGEYATDVDDSLRGRSGGSLVKLLSLKGLGEYRWSIEG